MKRKTIAKQILAVFIIIMVLGLTINDSESSTDEKQLKKQPETAILKASKAGTNNNARLNLDIIFVLDNSGSMIKNDPDFITKEVVTNFVDEFRKEFRLGMVIFDKDARLVEPLTEIASQEALAKFLGSLDEINYKGQFTNSPAGVERAIYELKKHGRKSGQKVIILLTDGIVDTGDKNQDIESEKWLRENLARESEKAGIRIFGIAFTDKADFRLIQILALKTNGEYFRAYSAGDIPDVFKNIIGIITNPPAESTPLTPAISKPLIPQVQKQASKPIPSSTKAPVKKRIALLPLVLSVIALLMGLIVLVTIYRRKTEDRITPAAEKNMFKTALPPDHPIFKAELIDTENIVSKDSLSLALSKESITIGRDSSNDIVIPEESVSSLHATIEYKNGHFYLEDHRSTNGTSLNGKQIKENEPVRLKSGDKIHFAIFEFRFLLHDMAPFGETIMLQKDDI